jgi:hypothetical protein
MIRVEFPEPDFRTRIAEGREEIFDRLRRAWVRLTPEEWVRQNVLRWLTEVSGYPEAMIAVEKELTVGAMRKRFDILVYGPGHEAWMLVECKAPSVPLTEKTLMQVLRYNMKVKASFLLITNGHMTYAADIRDVPAAWIARMPAYPALSPGNP